MRHQVMQELGITTEQELEHLSQMVPFLRTQAGNLRDENFLQQSSSAAVVGAVPGIATGSATAAVMQTQNLEQIQLSHRTYMDHLRQAQVCTHRLSRVSAL